MSSPDSPDPAGHRAGPWSLAPLLSRRGLVLAGAAAAGGLAIGAGIGHTTGQDDVPPRGPSMQHFLPLDAPSLLPPVAIERPDGSTGTVADFRGALVLLNLWATWCAPCVREMPALDRLQGRFDPRTLLVLPLSVDRGGARVVKPFYRQHKLDRLGIYLDKTNRVSRALRPAGLPTTYLVGPDGMMLGVLEGVAHWDQEDAVTLLRWYVRKTGTDRRRPVVTAT